MHHYVYRITNIVLNKHYYGCRSSKTEPQLDLGIKYFSSSTSTKFGGGSEWIKDQKENPSNYKYKIIRSYRTRAEALSLEIKLHNRFNVGINELFYNAVKQTSTGFDTSGTELSREHKMKIAESFKTKGHPRGMLNKQHSKKTKDRISASSSKAQRKRAKTIYQYNLDGVFIKEYDCLRSAAEAFKLNSAVSNIAKAIKNPHYKYKNYLWRNEYSETIDGYTGTR